MTSEEFGRGGGNDARLEALESEYNALNDAIAAGEREFDSAVERMPKGDQDTFNARLDALAERLLDITDEIMETPAAGARGVAVKLRIYRRYVLDTEARGCARRGDPDPSTYRDTPASFDYPERYAVYALADLERLAGSHE